MSLGATVRPGAGLYKGFLGGLRSAASPTGFSFELVQAAAQGSAEHYGNLHRLLVRFKPLGDLLGAV